MIGFDAPGHSFQGCDECAIRASLLSETGEMSSRNVHISSSVAVVAGTFGQAVMP